MRGWFPISRVGVTSTPGMLSECPIQSFLPSPERVPGQGVFSTMDSGHLALPLTPPPRPLAWH